MTAELHAGLQWRVVDFISDVHLHASEPATVRAWQAYVHSTRADALFILGDLFEVWVGDDAIDQHASVPSADAEVEQQCIRTLADAGQRLDLFFMHGNRDFLAADRLMSACHMRLLPDPTTLVFAGQRWLLSHGDALCLADTDYMRFRQSVRSAAWQSAFLATALPERRALAAELRRQSETHKRLASSYADVDTPAALQWLADAGARTLIHGHTHRPATHQLDALGHRRVVLSDWDASAQPPRLQVLRLTLSAEHRTQVIEPQRIALEPA